MCHRQAAAPRGTLRLASAGSRRLSTIPTFLGRRREHTETSKLKKSLLPSVQSRRGPKGDEPAPSLQAIEMLHGHAMLVKGAQRKPHWPAAGRRLLVYTQQRPRATRAGSRGETSAARVNSEQNAPHDHRGSSPSLPPQRSLVRPVDEGKSLGREDGCIPSSVT